MMATPAPGGVSAYDEVEYPGYTYPQTHPDRLFTLARLFGLAPAAPSRCRVLELGCGDGENLLPLALALPGSEFVGVDLAKRPITRAQGLAASAGLTNVGGLTNSAAQARNAARHGNRRGLRRAGGGLSHYAKRLNRFIAEIRGLGYAVE